MIVAIHQPQYLPWLGYFDKIDQADIFVLLDCVQYKKNEWQNRNRLKTPSGLSWITVPVLLSKGHTQLISEIQIDNTKTWQENHWKTFQSFYNKSPHFSEYKNFFEEIYNEKKYESLSTLNEDIIFYIVETLGIKTKIIRSSELGRIEGQKTELLINICSKLNATYYLSGAGAKVYLDTCQFKNTNIQLKFQEYSHPEYSQLFGKFEPYLSVIDLLFNCGGVSLEIIRSGRR